MKIERNWKAIIASSGNFSCVSYSDLSPNTENGESVIDVVIIDQEDFLNEQYRMSCREEWSENARELLMEIRNDEVNTNDEIDHFMRYHYVSELSKLRTKVALLELKIAAYEKLEAQK
jgi:subtilase family serine protease